MEISPIGICVSVGDVFVECYIIEVYYNLTQSVAI